MIGASYAEIASAARNMSNAAEEYIGAVNGLYNVVDNLFANWKGTDNLSYAEKVNSYKSDIIDLGEVVKDYASFLQQSSDIIQNTQESVSSAAGNL